jgi:hypothetical protein
MSVVITSFEDLYVALVALIGVTTGLGNKVWRKTGIQAQPTGPYATVYLTEGPSPSIDVVDDIEIENPATGEPSFTQRPWGTTHLECVAEFFRAGAMDAAVRFRNALQLEARYDDLWAVAGLAGEVRIVDVSTMFRADVEGRAQVRFRMYANVGMPLPLAAEIHEIDTQGVDVFRHDLEHLVAQTTFDRGDAPPYLDYNAVTDTSHLA